MKKLKILFFCLVILFFYVFTALFTFFIVEPKVYDFMIRNVLNYKLPFDNSKKINGSDDIVLVIIDDKSIQKYRWPWKRELNNKVLNYFHEYAKPKVVVHDFITTTVDIENPKSDSAYYTTINKMNNLIEGFAFNVSNYESNEFGDKYDKYFVEKFKLNNVQTDTKIPTLYNSIYKSPQEFLNSAHNLGSVQTMPGFFDGYFTVLLGDETHRTQEYLINYKGSILPSLSMKAFSVANKNPKIIVNNKYIAIPELGYKIKYIKTPIQIIIPTKFYKIDNSGYSHKAYSAVDIMDSYDNIRLGKKPIINPSEFDNKIIVFGAYVKAGQGLNDRSKTPMIINHPGADIQATAIDNLIHNDFLKLLPNWFNVFLSLFSVLFAYFIIKYKDLTYAINSILMMLLILLVFAGTCFYKGVIVYFATPIVLCFLTMVFAYINKYVIEERKKEKVTTALGKYMSEEVMKNVIKNIDNLGLGGKKATVTVLFSDIRGFTSLSEKLSAQEVSELLNEYFSQMEPIVNKYNGIINKFIGDAVMAVFGEPINDENHPINAVRCGYEMLKKVEELDSKWKEEGKPQITIGIGINTGEVFIGNIGSERRMEYTVIGDTVNLASRLESYNKIYKTKFLISPATYDMTKNYVETNKISEVEIRGKDNRIDIYEVKNVN